jgi:DNA (cytosine-5)-methyltransferase 1
MTLRYLSLFSGIGGFDLGFDRAGMECVGQVEYDEKARSVLARHWPDVKRLNDVKEIQGDEFGTVDLIAGGFPCQDVSVAGRREGLAGERSGLWFEFHRIIERVKPRWVVIENVPGLLSSNSGRDFATILRGLVECGYGVAWRVLDAQYFGVAQPRRRVFIVASLGDGAAASAIFDTESTYGDKAAAGIKEREDYPGDDSGYLYGHWWNGRDVSQTLDAVLYKKQALPEKNRFPAVMVPVWQRCACCEDYWCNIHHMHAYDCDCPPVEEFEKYPYEPGLLRWITPIEAERLQGFPDNYTDGQSDSARYRQLGNAVAVPVAEWVGRRIVEVNA